MNKIKINWFGKFVAMLVAFFALSVGVKAVPYTLNDIYQYPADSAYPNTWQGKQTDSSWWESLGVTYVGVSASWTTPNGAYRNVTVVTQTLSLGLMYVSWYSHANTTEVYHSEVFVDGAYGSPTSVTFHIYVSPVDTNPVTTDPNPALIHVY